MIRAEFVPIESRAFVTFDAPEPLQADAIYTIDSPAMKDAVVRFRYTATAEQAKRIDHRKLRDALYAAGAHKVYAIEANVERETRARVEGVDENLGEAAALDLYIEAQGIDPAMAERMRERTRTYMEGVL